VKEVRVRESRARELLVRRLCVRKMCVCVKPVITYGYFTISYNEARKTICGDNKN